jgi:rubredoxin
MVKTATTAKKSVTKPKSAAAPKAAGKETARVTTRKPVHPVKTASGKKPAAGKPVAAVKSSGVRAGARKSPKVEEPVKRYKCRICGYVYSPLRGEPHNGIPVGTAFEDLPEDYVCPICGMEGKGKIGKWGFEEWRPTRYVCSICNYVYDEKRGEPHRGIKPGTKFEDLPDDYTCPVCAIDPKIRVQFGKVFKQGFEPLQI